MNRLLSIIFAFIFVLMGLISCTPDNGNSGNEGGNEGGNETATPMTYEEYMAAEVDTPVTIEAYVQATQSWWDNKITVYAADEDGAYFIYEMACSEADAAKLTPGAKIKVSGHKGVWKGEIEVMDPTLIEVTPATDDSVISKAVDLTEYLGKDELIDYQNQLALFTEMTVVSVSYKNGEPGDDIYLTLSKDGKEYSFCVEVYLTGTNTEVYKAVGELVAGDVINVEGFLYWYDSMNPHVTAVHTVMNYDEYMDAKVNDLVFVEAYVQATQSWWNNKITVYAADEDGAYFFYEMACSEADAAKLTPGTKIRVIGYKTEWKGEVEVTDATFVFVDTEDTYVAEAKDLTDSLGTDVILDHQNQLALFTGMTVVSVSYKNDEPGDDIYLTLSKDGNEYNFCIEVYLTGTNTEVYETVGTLTAGDVVDVECFLYWYNDMNPHVTKIVIA